ncbi:MAG: hypothetical protein QOI96_1626, partial [Verrucomicrobiota bacterium]
FETGMVDMPASVVEGAGPNGAGAAV